jgi:transcriptional regulator with XRE-family HTH domain
MNPTEINTRRTRLRLSQQELADLAGLDGMTVWRTFQGRSRPLNETVQKMNDALTAEELRLRDHLITLHGLPQGHAA